MIPRSFALAALAIAGVLTTGCSREHYRYHGQHVEERYRVFFTRELPGDLTADASVDEISRFFSPEQSVRGSVDALRGQGFELAEIRQIDWSDGATLFVFRRKIAEEDVLDRSPVHFTGVFRQALPEGTTYYAFVQRQNGYLVHLMGPGGLKTIDTHWEGRELVWTDEAGRHDLQLTPDANTLYHVTDDGTEGGRVVKTALRVVDQTPEDYDVREARRHLARLRPRTPRTYDPFPW